MPARRIVALEAHDVRFPTSLLLDGSDAMHTDPDYSAAYVVLTHRRGRRPRGSRADVHDRPWHRGVRRRDPGARAARRRAVRSSSCQRDMRGFWRSLVSDSQLRWLGPEKGVIHLATAAVVNAVWDLWAKQEGKPLWKLLVDLSPEEVVGLRGLPVHHRCADARRGARASPRPAAWPGRARGGNPRRRLSGLHHLGRLARLSEDAKVETRSSARRIADGFTHVKMKVGADLDADDLTRGADPAGASGLPDD